MLPPHLRVSEPRFQIIRVYHNMERRLISSHEAREDTGSVSSSSERQKTRGKDPVKLAPALPFVAKIKHSVTKIDFIPVIHLEHL